MNYELLRTIRSSNDWLVWRGEHAASKARFLIKQMQPSTNSARLAERLAEEQAFFQPLEHVHLIRPRQYNAQEGCLLFEDVQGSLAQLLEQERRLSPELTAGVLLQCLAALAYLHDRRLGHGCVSTHTILVDPQGAVKLGDFVGYRFDEGAPPPPDHPMKYQAPEMLDGTLGQPGPSADLYCLGHAALEMLLGEEYPLLFTGPGGSAADVEANWLGWHAHPGRELVNLAQSLSHVPPVLVEILGKMVRKNPAQRAFRSAADVRQALVAAGLSAQKPLPGLRDLGAPPAKEQDGPAPPRRRKRGRTLSLKWARGKQVKQQKFLPDQAVVVGSQAPCEVLLQAEGISRRHALLACQANGSWWAYDLHSSQGTWHNGVSIRAVRLRSGDELRFGPVRCRVDFVARRGSRSHIGPFQALQTLHKGRNGALYRAAWRDNPSHPIVAVRVFPSEFGLDPDAIRRFLRGIPQAASFRHPNLLRLYRGGFLRRGGKRLWFLAMEHMAGGSLRDRLARSGPQTVPVAFRWARQVLLGLQAIADQHLLHRNLSPSCILFDEQDQVKIGDFVMMRGDEAESFQQITRAGASSAEHVYQAPEQVLGAADLTIRCDLYSLAAILYEALTGRPPFPPHLRLPDMVQAICQQPVPPPRTINPSLPAEIDAFFLLALEKQPQRRIGSPQEFEQRLSAIESVIPAAARNG